ncbi:MAG: hypothetical protein AAGA87_05055 [Pseudomonadota bacterium]
MITPPCQVAFRTLQTICDLRAVARQTPPRVAQRLAAGTDGLATPESVAHLIHRHGCRLTTRAHIAMHPGLVVAATLPGDDPEAFQAATAILLADRLQSGRGTDDLFWHWDGFHDAYDALDPAARAAILQGYAQGTRDGFIPLLDPPKGQHLATRPEAEVEVNLSTIQGPLTGASQQITAALHDPSAMAPASKAWEDLNETVIPAAGPDALALITGFRHLFETRPAFEPFPGTLFDLADARRPVIPT